MGKSEDIPPCMIYIDKEGRWFYEGAEIIRREIILHFYRHMELDPQGRYIIDWNGQRCYLDVEDAPFVVQRAEREERGGPDRYAFVLYLNDDTREELAPESLWVGKDNVLYCRVKDGKFPARFSRPAYYQICEFMIEQEGAFFLPIDGKKYTIRTKDS
ncbi:MAG: DUF1285 domain-containing protein [Deltaproteobacteria bacterium]|nr:DUF1285 domain-containing protein [Deltaproteobacteria bacterium]